MERVYAIQTAEGYSDVALDKTCSGEDAVLWIVRGAREASTRES